MAGRVYRGGVFGFGGMGQEFTTRINFDRWYGEEFEIVGVCNRGAEKRKLAEDRFGLKAFQDPKDLLKEGLDFAIVASTTVAHCEQGCMLAEAGVPMLMEKPIALTVAEARQMVDAAARNNVTTVVNFHRRFTPEFQYMQKIVSDGTLGDVLSAEASVYRGVGVYSAGYRHRAVVEPEESGGWSVHHACHQVDIMCWILGEVDTVSVVSKSTVPDKFSEEIVMGRLMFKNGAIGHVFDTVGGVKGEHHAIVGTNGGVATTAAAGATLINLRVTGDRDTGPARVIDPRETFKYIDPIHHLLQIVKDGGKSHATVEDAAYSLKVTIAMRESARREGTPLKVDEIGK